MGRFQSNLKYIILLLVISAINLFAFQNCAKQTQGTTESASHSQVHHQDDGHFVVSNENSSGPDFHSKLYYFDQLFRWPGNTVSWYYSDVGRPSSISKAEAIAAFQAAAAVWGQVSGFNFVYVNETSSAPALNFSNYGNQICSSMNANVKIVGWGNGGTNGIGGITYNCYSGSSFSRANVIINSAYGVNATMLKRIAQHEFGHMAGLGDFGWGSNDENASLFPGSVLQNAIMYYSLSLDPDIAANSATKVATPYDSYYSRTLYGQPAQTCSVGATQSCQTTNTSNGWHVVAGQQSCIALANGHGNAWSDCVETTQPVQICTPNQPQVCMLPNQQQGIRTCNADGSAWGVCTAVTPPVYVCQPGTKESCALPSSTRPGIRTCNPDGQAWGACVAKTKAQYVLPIR